MPKRQKKIPIPERSEKSSKTGISELDNVLGGGIPEDSIVLLAGPSGSGKTLLCFQWLFEGVRNGENGIYISITEPLFKSLKNLEKLSFYDRDAVVSEKLKLIDVREVYSDHSFEYEKFLHFIEKQVAEANAKRLCIDSITALAYSISDKADIRTFIFELGKILGTRGCTTVITSEVTEPNKFSVYGVEEFISDVILRLDQVRVKGELERVLQIIKVRGREYGSGDLYFKITNDGIVVFPRLWVPLEYASTTEKISTGIPLLDELTFGGVFRGSSTLLAGGTGTGKTLLGLQFLVVGTGGKNRRHEGHQRP